MAGNPLIRLDPTGHCWVVCAIVHAVTHAVKAAVKVVAVVADTTLGISSMISDVKIIFSGKTNFFQKVLAVGDLSLNAFMDVTTVIGVGEGLRAGYLGVKAAGTVGLRALGKVVVHDGEDAVGHVIEHEVADVAEHTAAGGAKEVLLDTSAMYDESVTKAALKEGERGVISETTWQELEANAKRAEKPMGIQRWARSLERVPDAYNPQTARELRQYMEYYQATDAGRMGDVAIGSTALVTGRTLITGDNTLYRAVNAMGGDARFIR